MSARRFLFCLGLLVAVIAAALLRAESIPVAPAAVTRSVPGCCSVQLSEFGGAFDLALDPGKRYELIVSSLGDASQTFRVDFESEPRAGVERIATRPVPPLGTRSQALLGNAASEALLREWHCDLKSTTSAPHDTSRRRFFLHVTAAPLEDAAGYVPITGDLAGEGHGVRIYVDAEIPASSLAPDLVSETIRLLDSEIIPRSRELLGVHADVDGDGKLAVLVTPWLGRMCGGRTSLNGCVRANDFQTGVESPYGNAADVLYLNSQLPTGPALKTLLAHEYTHAVCFSRRFAREAGALPVEDDWLNEAIAHVAENLHETGWSNLEERIARFLAAPQSSPLVVTDYYRAGLWRDAGCRGATYLFLRYCVDRFGPGLLGRLVESPLTGPRNLEQATGVPLPDLFRQWTIALARDEIPSLPPGSQLDRLTLTGANRIQWRLDDAPCTVDLRGTATSLIRLAPTNRGVRRIIIRNPPAARLQVTLLRSGD